MATCPWALAVLRLGSSLAVSGLFEYFPFILNGVRLYSYWHAIRDGDTGSGRQGSLSDDVYELQLEDEHRAGRNGADATVTVAQLARHV